MARKASRTNTQSRLIRLCEIILLLSRSKLGLTGDELRAETRISRSTFHRELGVLRSAGVPIELREGRYRFLSAPEVPALGLSALQLASLQLARRQLAPLGGTLLLQELDRLLVAFQSPKKAALERQTSFEFAQSRKPVPEPKIVRAIERALASRRRACIEYCDRAGASSRIHIEPLVVNVAEDDPYVRAFCVERGELRTYKLSRIQFSAHFKHLARRSGLRSAAFRWAVFRTSRAPCAIESLNTKVMTFPSRLLTSNPKVTTFSP